MKRSWILACALFTVQLGQLHGFPRERRWIPDRISDADYGMDSVYIPTGPSYGIPDPHYSNNQLSQNYLPYYWSDHYNSYPGNVDSVGGDYGMLYRANLDSENSNQAVLVDPVQQLRNVQAYSYAQTLQATPLYYPNTYVPTATTYGTSGRARGGSQNSGMGHGSRNMQQLGARSTSKDQVNLFDHNPNPLKLVVTTLEKVLNLGQEVNEQETKTDEVQETKAKVQETKADVKESKAEVKETKAEVQETKAEVQETKAEVQETKAEVQETKAEVQETNVKVQEMQARAQEPAAEIQEVAAELQDTEAEVQDTEAEVQDTEAEVQDKEAEVQDTDAKVQDSDAQVQDTEVEVQDTEAEVQDTEAEVQDTEAEVQDTDAEVQDTEAEMQDTEAEVQDTEAEVQDTEAEVQDTEAEVQDTEAEVQDTKAKVQDTEAEVQDTEAEVKGAETSQRAKPTPNYPSTTYGTVPQTAVYSAKVPVPVPQYYQKLQYAPVPSNQPVAITSSGKPVYATQYQLPSYSSVVNYGQQVVQPTRYITPIASNGYASTYPGQSTVTITPSYGNTYYVPRVSRSPGLSYPSVKVVYVAPQQVSQAG